MFYVIHTSRLLALDSDCWNDVTEKHLQGGSSDF